MYFVYVNLLQGIDWGYSSKDFTSKHRTPFRNSFHIDTLGRSVNNGVE